MNTDILAWGGRIGLAAAAFAIVGWSSYTHGVQSERTIWERKQALAERRARELTEANAAETARRFAAQQEIINAALEEKRNARLDADRADAVARSLRDQIGRVAAACSPSRDTGPTQGGEATGTPGDLLAHVLGRIDEAANRIARHADEARAAGLACERSYDALTGGENG